MTLETLEQLHEAFSDFMQEPNPPASTDIRYRRRTRWFNRGREDIAKRHFFKSLLKSATLPVVSGTASYTLPEDFGRANGLYVLASSDGSIVYTNPYETRSLVAIARDHTTGRYQLTFTPTPTGADSAVYWYFATPPPLVNPTDPVLVDGEATLYFALKQHFFTVGPLDKFAESRDEYENIVAELIENNDIPPPGALTGIRNSAMTQRGTTSEKGFYTGNTRRRF